MTNRVCFKTLGCRLNQAETAVMAGQFVANGYSVVPFDEQPDVCVIHTCTITAKAERESKLIARTVKQRNPNAVVILAGCAVEAGPERLTGAADILAGQAHKQNLPALVAEWRQSNTPPAQTTTGDAYNHGAVQDGIPLFGTTRALVRVQDGCSFRCSYCIVPMARGPANSRPQALIVEDCVRVAAAGYREVVLVGANIGCFSEGGHKLPHLLAAIENVPGIERIRISSIEPTTIERDLIDCMVDSSKICRSLHLPLQSGDDGILRLMRRRYTTAQYRNMIDYALDRIPRLGLGTDIITGFPGETPEAFANTLQLVEQVPFSNLHVFPYSLRQGTAAASLPAPVDPKVARQRAARLIAEGKVKRSIFARQFIGTPVQVLTEPRCKEGIEGWTREYVTVRLARTTPPVNTIATVIPVREADGILYDL